MRENHPDSLAARGVPAEFIARANDKVAAINAAWDRISASAACEPAVRDLPPNQDDRPAGTPIDMLILHYTGMQTAQEAIERLRDPRRVSAH